MTVGFYSAKQGLSSMQTAMDITANNIANVETDGYKPFRASFSDLVYTVRDKKNKADVDTGHGTKVDKTDLMFDIGSLRNTGNMLDFAIPTEGFFKVQRSDGTTAYTRNGAFIISKLADGTSWLADQNGSRILDKDGNPIPAAYKEDGTTIDYEKLQSSIGIYNFSNPYGLKADGNNYYLSTQSSGEGVAAEKPDIISGFLENSSSDIANEMVNVIQYQKAFSMNAKMVQTADELEKLINNLR